MKNFDKYERQYFLPPVCEYDWAEKRLHRESTNLVFRETCVTVTRH